MDLHSQLKKNMDDIVHMFESRMDCFDKELAQSQASKISSVPFKDLSGLAAEYSSFKDLVWKTLCMLRQQLQLLSEGFDKHEAMSRNKILLFHGLKETDDEGADSVIKSVISDHMKLPSVVLDNIDVCHRLGSKRDRPRPILVRFAGLKYRHIVWNSKTMLKGCGCTVSEFLTKPRQEVFVAARKHFGMSNCWTSEETIVIALPDKSRKKIVASSELQSLIVKFPHDSSAHQEPYKQGTRTRRMHKLPTAK